MYGRPKFYGIHNFHKLLKDNATNVTTDLTNGNYGFFPLIISPTDWETLYGHEWITPHDPGNPPILAAEISTLKMKNIILRLR